MPSFAVLGIMASLIAGAMTGIGGLAVMLGGPLDDTRHNRLTGFAAGVMIAAAFFSLIIPGLERALASGSSIGMAAAGMVGAVMLGALAIAQLGPWVDGIVRRRFTPAGLASWRDNAARPRVALFVVAITLHNIPEGTAVGLSFMSGDTQLGWATALGIGIQNVPEGMAVAAVLSTLGWSRLRCATAALVTGLIEPVGGTVGVAIVQASAAALPWALGFSAGAMLFVVMAEMIPESRRKIAHGSATPALFLGLAVMMALDISLG